MKLIELILYGIPVAVIFFMIGYGVAVKTAEPKSLSSYYTKYYEVDSMKYEKNNCTVVTYDRDLHALNSVTFMDCPPVKVGQDVRFTVEFVK